MIVYTKALATSLIISRGLCAGHGKVLLGVVYFEAVTDCAFITDRSGLCPSLLYEGLVNLGYSVSSGVE